MKYLILTSWRRHLSYWAIYGAYFYLINSLTNTSFSLISLALMLPYFAFVFYTVVYLLRRYFAPRRYVQGGLLLLLFYGISGFLVYSVLYGQLGINLIHGRYILRDYAFEWRQFVQSLLVMHGHFSMLAFLYFHYQGKLKALEDQLAEKEMRMEAEEEKQEYEYTALAAQVNPHMMVNVFQSWEVQIREVDPLMASQFGGMYQLMKFYMKAHEPGGSKMILLYDELEAVKNYLQLQPRRMGVDAHVAIEVIGNLYRFAIPPTTVLTLVENAFKHGDIGRKEQPLRISVCCDQQGYLVQVENQKRHGLSAMISHGQGLHNLKRRLEIAFGSRSDFKVNDTAETYEAVIRVNYTA
ncbi:sensor histidine kinase [Sphingobacterium faecale]|uniref:Histidine kinase n=1 Tax=Sphingobacterium faecale TaxID=2803775 RepID=A0ABS1QYY9_9SPHI|nr:histidine kinase [Sphingobacterium faecale]MBL1407648.1 histidine kinase [Sphingobacterium faecale]